MKKALLFLSMLFVSLNFYGQPITITSLQANAVQNGVNVNLQTFCGTYISFLEHTYTITGNQINLSVCYYISPLTVISEPTHSFFIPTPTTGNYNVIATVYSSQSPTVCDYSTVQDTETTTLSNSDFGEWEQSITLFPNPTNGYFQIKDNHQIVLLVKVYNTIGQLIKVSSNLNNNISDLENGTYLVVMETDNGKISKKILLRK